MATIFMEPSEIGAIGTPLVSGDWVANATGTAGAWSGYCLSSSNTAEIKYKWDSSVSTFYGQGRFNLVESSGVNNTFLKFYSPNGTCNVSIRKDTVGNLVVYRGDAGTLLGTSSGITIVDNTWFYLQWYIVINDSTGAVTLKANNSTVLTLTSQDTRNDAGANGDQCNTISFDTVAGDQVKVDDVIINDTTGSVNTSYPDNQGIEALMPNAAGDNTGLLRGGSDSGNNYGQVDEIPYNDATDYVYDSVVDDYDLYNIPSTNWSTVSAVALHIRAASSDAGAANVAHIVKADTDTNGTADTEYTGSDIALSTTWQSFIKHYNQNPDSTDWTAAKVNALQIGAKVR